MKTINLREYYPDYYSRQHRTIWQEHSAKDFASYESYKRAGILYVFPPFITARMGQRIGRRPQTQLCGDASTDEYIDVSDEVLIAMEEETRAVNAAERKKYRYLAQYSLDSNDGIEHYAINKPLSPEAILENRQNREELYSQIMSLPEKQAKRIYARFYLGMTVKEIARMEGIAEANIYSSIQRGLSRLKKEKNNFSAMNNP